MAFSSHGQVPGSSNSRQANLSDLNNFDPEWVNLVKLIPNAKDFVTAFFSPKAEECVKYLSKSMDVEPILTISILGHAFSSRELDTIFLKTTENGRAIIPTSGSKFQVMFQDPTIFQPIPSYILPSYSLEAPGKPGPSLECSGCETSLKAIEGNNCISCGKRLCVLCTNLSPVLHLGFNSKKPICAPCLHKSAEINALTWINQAKLALTSGEPAAARIFLGIGHGYSTNITGCGPLWGVESSISMSLDAVKKLAVDLQDYKTKIICLQYQGLKEFGWGPEALKMCQDGEHLYPYALACLKLVNPKPCLENPLKWMSLGDKFANIHSELACFCYNQCYSKMGWIGKALAILKTKDVTEVQLQVAYRCMGMEVLDQTRQLKLANGFLDNGSFPQALFLLSACNIPLYVVLEQLRIRYGATTSGYQGVIALMNYVIIMASPEVIRAFPKSDPVLHILKELSGVSTSSTTFECLIKEKVNVDMDKIDNLEATLLFPLALISYKAGLGWETLEELADSMGCANAAKIFRRIEDIDTILTGRRRQNDPKWDIEKESFIEEL